MSTEGLLSLEDLSAAIAHWRAHRQPRSVPVELKRNAVALLSQYRKAEVRRSLQITHSLLDRWQQQYGNVTEACEAGLVALPSLPDTHAHVTDERRLPLTVRGSRAGVELQGELTVAQWQQALSLVS